MIKEFIPYEQALALKELGFDEPCFIRVWWLNSVHYQTKVPFKPHITMNGQDIKFEYLIPEKHPLSGFDALELQVPTFSQAFRFFREKYGLHSYIEPVLVEKANSPIKYDYVILEVSHQNDLEYNNLPYHTFEETELECLKKLIEIVKQ